MANRNYPQKLQYSPHLMPVSLDMQVSIGSSGAPTIANSSNYFINSITRLAAGQYRIQLQDNYQRLLSFQARFRAPVTGSSVPSGSLSAGTVYQITAVGSTNWVTAGVPAGITPAIGVSFKAAGTAAGTGTAKAIGNSGIGSVELLSDVTQMLSNQPFQYPNGGYIDFQCLAPTNSSTTTAIPTDPASGSVMYIQFLLSNSSVQ